MRAKGRHRRPKNNAITRRIAVAGTGGAALAMPLIGATAAEAQPAAAAQAPQVMAMTKTAQAVAAGQPAKAPAKASAKPVIYSVVTGDTLSEIAQEHSVSGGWQQLYADNKALIGSDPSVIRPGLKLTIGGPAKAAPAVVQAAAAPAKSYPNNLDGWIRESLDVMAKHGIPGTYHGIHRNVMRESSGNPRAINLWDSNAAAGIPSKGLLQVIDPTFKAYHVPGTSLDSYDPVANITAACNYAAARYGSIDNVFGAY
ncbi:LysM peptidoglycan-binding domain-containing protein [Streptomyces antimicrobicus]|uniref:LysM peptidoglycan-binding domain-containing protein n=1 Tax=Streptomyces antimicrobicus TaxID=2883108 RepID=A0ABS8B7C5_9ACTN|nr:LysM peptidoglycan-binding domain-containing protein [Streptomyces antimicrobicus]MCB5180466.1 LysM peptidoglycan-binding domain-containing protein [Streptomyces antimicrobicus]